MLVISVSYSTLRRLTCQVVSTDILNMQLHNAHSQLRLYLNVI